MRPSFPSATREDDSVESKTKRWGGGKKEAALISRRRRREARRRFAYIRRSNITVDTREAPGSGG